MKDLIIEYGIRVVHSIVEGKFDKKSFLRFITGVYMEHYEVDEGEPEITQEDLDYFLFAQELRERGMKVTEKLWNDFQGIIELLDLGNESFEDGGRASEEDFGIFLQTCIEKAALVEEYFFIDTSMGLFKDPVADAEEKMENYEQIMILDQASPDVDAGTLFRYFLLATLDHFDGVKTQPAVSEREATSELKERWLNFLHNEYTEAWMKERQLSEEQPGRHKGYYIDDNGSDDVE